MTMNQYDWDILVGGQKDIERVINNMLHQPNRKFESPDQHPAELHLMNKNFDYIEGFFPVVQDMDVLIVKLDELLKQ